jgi:hypothetical protein
MKGFTRTSELRTGRDQGDADTRSDVDLVYARSSEQGGYIRCDEDAGGGKLDA